MTGSAHDAGPGEGATGLTISGGGSAMVATDVVFVEVATLRLLQGEAEGWQSQLAQVRGLGVSPAPGWQPDDLGSCVFGASAAITEITDDCRRLADSLVEAAEEYGRLEAGLDTGLRSAGSLFGHALGAMRLLAPLVALSLATPLAYLAVTSLLVNAVLGRGVSVVPPALANWLQESPRLLTDPVTVALVRALVASVDDVVLGGGTVPYPVAAAAGDDGAGLLGAPASALGALVAARAAGILRETPVRVRRVNGSSPPERGPTGATTRRPGAGAGAGVGAGLSAGVGTGRPAGRAGGRAARPRSGSPAGPVAPAPAPRSPSTPSASRRAATPTPAPQPRPTSLTPPTPPAGFADLADRIPTEDDGGQVRLERYGDAEHPSWLLYIGGTLEWSPTGSTEPWDMTSNVTAVAGQESGSYRAVLQAMQQAGVQPGDPVVPIAHSQGGLIAAELAARGDINAVGLVTFGAPAGQVAVSADLPAIAIEHSDDIIPALGGTAADDGRLYVRHELFGGVDVPVDEPLPAHQLAGYRDTARLVDASVEPRLLAFRDHLGTVVGTIPGEQSVWRAERVD
ncbi:hypothetical protein K2F54_11335 [Cryobacterium sp. 1639]|uniref:hypothetical protein n=1 Tax=Cryobacterium inferilacus TaxID=2866629 RepID=UPI001C72BE14|nr:hypothetical protein [Cryobacterium sp. 1639]MBX0300569.1 hypothetical protein [Cryobacterium sp. 1639]